MNIIEWANNISKGDPLAQELAHYGIEQFMTHKRYPELSQRPGDAKGFIIAIMRNSWWGKKSEFSRIHKAHRSDIGHRKRAVTDEYMDRLLDQPEELYDFETDRLIESIQGLLEEMELDHEGKLWYNSRLFQMWLETPNYSELSRRTDIPRTSISNAVDEAREYILQELKNRKII